MMKQVFCPVVLAFLVAAPLAGSAATLSGRVEVRKQPVAEARVGLWVSGGAANAITQAKTNAAGEFRLELPAEAAGSEVYYLVAEAGSVQGSSVPKLSLLAILGTPLPKQVVLNEFTSVASTWPNAQLLEGTALRGSEAGLRIGAGEPTDRTRVEYLLGLASKIGADRGNVAHHVRAYRGGEMTGSDCRRFGVGRSVLGEPLSKTTVEHHNVIMAEAPQRPPYPRRGHRADPIVDHDFHPVANAETGHMSGEDSGVRQHVGQRIGRISDFVQIPVNRAWDVALGILVST